MTRRHIIKGSTGRPPYVALNEHLACRLRPSVAGRKTELSTDGQAIVVHRFDVDATVSRFGLEDFCVLLALRPAAKYDTTWERIAKAVRDHVPGSTQRETFQKLATILLLTYALRNADCHAKNIALLYSTRADVRLAPVYDMITTVVYPGFQHNPPGISFLGKKTWVPGKTLEKFIPRCSASRCGRRWRSSRQSAMRCRIQRRECGKPWRSTRNSRTSASACCSPGAKEFTACAMSVSIPWRSG